MRISRLPTGNRRFSFPHWSRKLFDHIESEAAPIRKLCTLSGCREDGLYRLLKVMKRMELIGESCGLWFNSQAARRYLVTKSPSYMGDFFLYRRAMQDNFRLMTQKISLNAASEATRREDSDSPIHWQKPQGQGPAKRVNDYLVKMFERLLKNAEALEGMADRESVMKDIETEIDRQIFFEQL